MVLTESSGSAGTSSLSSSFHRSGTGDYDNIHWQNSNYKLERGQKGNVLEAELKSNCTGSQLMSFELQAKNYSEQRTFRDNFSQQMLSDEASAALHVAEKNKPPQQ